MHWQDKLRELTWFFFIKLDGETLQLWQRYQLTVAPMTMVAVCVLAVAVVARNIMIGQVSSVGSVAVLCLLFLISVSSLLFKQFFFRLMGPLALIVMPAMIYQHFSWPAGQPSPTLPMFSIAVLLQASSNNVRIGALYLLTGLGLLVHNSFALLLSDWNNISFVLGVGITMCMLYLAAVILWIRLVRLFKARTSLMESIRQSIEVRRSLLKIFYDEISAPLDALIMTVDAPSVDWSCISALNQTLSQAIVKARAITLEVGRKLTFSPHTLAKEIDQIRHDSWMAIVHSAVGVVVLLFVVYLLGPWPIRVPLIVGLVVTLALSRAAKTGVNSLLLRRLTIYVLAALIAWACFRRLEVGEVLYSIMYFMVVISSAVIISGIVDALIVAGLAATCMLWWYLAVPLLPHAETIIRFNIVIVLLFTTIFSVIMGYWLARIMVEINGKEQKLLIETDMCQRLMATLFHDVANPLQVIISRAEFAQMGRKNADDESVVKDLACKIRRLLEVTRELENIDLHETFLTLEPVSLKEVFDDLQQIFSERLAAKNITLHIEPTGQVVNAHRAVLSMSVFSNLLTNALKFSPRGGKITIVCHEGSLNATHSVCVSIIDEGTGIPAATIASMNSNELIESAPGTEGEAGHGQGLRLASLYLSKMQGKLQLDDIGAVKVHLQKSGPG